jgi:hypothetical protein
MSSAKKSVLEPFDDSSYVRARCYLYDGYYSPLMANPVQEMAHAIGYNVINIILSHN